MASKRYVLRGVSEGPSDEMVSGGKGGGRPGRKVFMGGNNTTRAEHTPMRDAPSLAESIMLPWNLLLNRPVMSSSNLGDAPRRAARNSLVERRGCLISFDPFREWTSRKCDANDWGAETKTVRRMNSDHEPSSCLQRLSNPTEFVEPLTNVILTSSASVLV